MKNFDHYAMPLAFLIVCAIIALDWLNAQSPPRTYINIPSATDSPSTENPGNANSTNSKSPEALTATVRSDRMSEFYNATKYGRQFDFETDLEFCNYCQTHYPNAIYPTITWTADEVIQSYYDTPEIWEVITDSDNVISYYFCWTPDYLHCFILDIEGVFLYSKDSETSESLKDSESSESLKNPENSTVSEDSKSPTDSEPSTPEDSNNSADPTNTKYADITSGWLCVDGVRVQDFGHPTTDSLYPADLVALYRSHDWDGSKIYSTDLSTCATVDSWSGKIQYLYAAWRYDETTDPENFAYTDFDLQPWWRQPDAPAAALATLDPRYVENDPWDSIWIEDDTRAYYYMPCDVYPDLPTDYDTTDIYHTNRIKGLGTYCLDSTGASLFLNGDSINSWTRDIDLKRDTLLMPFADPQPAFAHDLAYLYTDSKILALRDDGEIATVASCIIKADTTFNRFFDLTDGEITYWNMSDFILSSHTPVSIATDVININFSNLALFSKSDGTYFITTRFPDGTYGDYHAEYAGPESMDYYATLYSTMHASSMLFW